MRPADRASGRWLRAALLTVSIAVPSLVGAFLTAAHAPARVDRSAVGAFISSSRLGSGSWQAVHILAAGCNCSRKVAEHLISRKPLSNLRETVLIVGKDATVQSKLAEAGFRISTMGAEEAAERYHLRGTPWLVFESPTGKIVYAGGYAWTADALNGYQDTEIWKELQAGPRSRSFRHLAVSLAGGCNVPSIRLA